MSIKPGTRIGPFEVISPLGEGGMGVVFRAHDIKLQRDVALKLLPHHFANDPERLARFQREAQLLASVNHPNIAQIYGLEDSTAQQCIVMELVEGETLQERLRRGPISVNEALPIATQIAEALEAAHERGIVHRDLKPANVKTTPEGHVKVLDFGLAKMFERAPTATAPSDSPTLVDGTMDGVILGTPSYMSPEQARGQQPDRTSDMWAFGCVLYEMLTGKCSFSGHTITDILAAVVKVDPDWSALPEETPAAIRRLLRRCLQKDRYQRLRDIRDARIEIEEAPSETESALPHRAGRKRAPWLVGALGLAVALAVTVLYYRRTPDTAGEVRLDINTPPTTDPASFAISPDASKLVFVATVDGQPQLWLRLLGSTIAEPIADTEGASFPFWSPDSRSIGFFAGGMLKRADIVGGAAQMLASAPTGRGGAWSTDGVILFAPTNGGMLYRVSAAGGEAVPVTHADGGQTVHRFPHFLPNGRHFLFLVPGTTAARGVYLGSLDSSEQRRLLDADAAAVFLPPEYILFMRQGTLFAQRFDTRKLETVGDPFAVAEQVAFNRITFKGALSASTVGVVAYRTRATGGPRQLTWLDRTGKLLGTVGEKDLGLPFNPELSPDGKLVAVDRAVSGNRDIWLLDTARGVRTRFTSEAGIRQLPIWSTNGSRIVFASTRKTLPVPTPDLYQKTLSGTGEEELLLESSQVKLPTDLSADGRFLLYKVIDPKTGYDLWAMPLSGDRKPFPVASTRFDEREGQFSPDSNWIAYQSNESGRFEIYVQPFPGPGVKSPLSANGGVQPRWRKDGKELFYVALDGKLISAPITLSASGQRIAVGKTSTLFTTRLASDVTPGPEKQQYAVWPDGQRFLMNVTTEEQATTPITLILNWKPKP